MAASLASAPAFLASYRRNPASAYARHAQPATPDLASAAGHDM
jgi:hypothetical protein